MIKKMSPELLCEDAILKERFKSLNDFEGVAHLLEIPVKELRKVLVLNKKYNYTTFKIKKKNGNDRTIYAPQKNLSIIQKKFSYILSLVYNNHLNSHGFIKERSIVTNAEQHIKQKFILNIDLENFFESINFGRVRAMFIHYFKFNELVATTLANICCHYDGFLPQGAATSPIISNILSFKMDKELTKLAKKNHCIYSRYADDITFSTKKNQFPKDIAYIENSFIKINSELLKVIMGNGFFINKNKTRLNSHREKLSVTGITVNEKLNVERKYIRKIRSILHCIEKNINDIEVAKSIFNEKYRFRQRKEHGKPDMFDVLRGMISYVGQVKGKNDQVFLKLAKRYNLIVELIDMDLPIIKLPISKRKFQEDNTFVIESLYYPYFIDGESAGEAPIGQGTGFLLKGIGLITNAHVFKGEYTEMLEIGATFKKIEIHRSKYSSGKKHYASLLHYDKIKDIAILSVDGLDMAKMGFEYNEFIEPNMEIQLLGYPNFRDNMDISIKSGTVLGVRYTDTYRLNSEKRYEISAHIYGGNSGGPVVNENNEAVAVAVKGITDDGSVPSEVIPIKEVIELAKKKNIIPLKG
ncbi:RNA-dependent DNA polymerase [Bacillus wiedmannii]|uniref:reverse transcriptase domain-containing protein n=1 Tax=Bacillus wiedmannii TaxID=1890302 RepID=UPI000BF4F4E8|nr:reverse transcriptase domain-containing protein [Bacillus wiedmannii]PEN45077.1 RNA-dependent DNA polymerase [Bacillus wiedmannii]